MSSRLATDRASCLKLRRLIGAACVVFCLAVVAAAQDAPPEEAGELKAVPPKTEPAESPEAPKADAASDKPDEDKPTDETKTPTEDKPTDDAKPAESGDDAAPAAARRGPTDPAELEAFLDGIMAVHMQDKHIAGATISVVVDNQPFFSKGYGYADLDAKKPVDPDTTMFRIGSVSKLLTWTAVMQLVEQGKLDLDADINTYLKDFQIPATYPEPITLKHLMSHTPGFEDDVVGLFAHEPQTEKSLGELLADNIPARIRPSGQLASYSNHGTAIAGHIVAQVSGMPWEDYIEQKILKPLGMDHTLVRQPAADEMPPEMSKGYKYQNGRYEEEGFEYIPLAPAGAVSSSAGDMARFLIAHLQDGHYDDTQILDEATARQMRELLFAHDERLAGMGYGFMRMNYNGEQIVHHGGDTELFHSFFVMLPQRKTGFFVSYNTDTGAGVRTRLLESFVDRYFPAAEPPAAPAEPKPDELERFAGKYGGTRHSYTSITKLGALANVVTVTPDDGQLVLSGLGQSAKRFVPIEPLLFRELDDQETLAFRQDDTGQITHLFFGNNPVIAYERLSNRDTPQFVLALIGICALVFLSAVIGWPWAAFIAWGAPHQTTFGSHLASWLAWLASVAALAWLAALAYFARAPEQIVYGVSPALERLLSLTPLLVALAAVVLFCAVVAWLRGWWRFSGRLHYTCVMFAALAFVWFLHYGNLLQMRL